MTWFGKLSLARILMGAAIAWVSVGPLHAQTSVWSEYAFISSTLGVSDSRICIGEGSRGELGCPTYAPTISPTGRINATAGLTVDSVSLTTTGTTWGYLGSGASYIPNLSTNNISLTTINGQPISSFGSSATVISGTTSMNAGVPDAIKCNTNMGERILYISTGPDSNGDYYYAEPISQVTATLNHYIRYNSSGTYVSASSIYASVGSCTGSLSSLYSASRAFNFIGNSGAGGGASGDTLISGTLTVTANSATSIVSLTTASTTWGYLSAAGSYLPKLNTTTVSTTALQISGTVTTCSATNAGTLRYSSSTTALELCTGTGWQTMGVGIPAGTISAFASTTCPTGWSEYTAARGRFLRGIDNSAGNDADGTRAPGTVQTDVFKSHKHDLERLWSDSSGSPDGLGTAVSMLNSVTPNQDYGTDPRGLGIAIGTGSGGGGYMTNALRNTGGAETRPKNVAVTFCQFNGTSNGWNNPLSGGSTVPGGSNGQIQFNSAGAFAGSAGLTWDNAASRFTATHISTSSLTVNGVSITGLAGGSGDRITSGTQSILASQASGTIQVSGTMNVSGTVKVGGPLQPLNNTGGTCTADKVGAITVIDGRLHICRM